MIHRIVQMALQQRFLVLMVTLLIIIAGAWSFKQMPVDAYPDLSPPMVELITQWPGHAAEEVERLTTLPARTGDERIAASESHAVDFVVRALGRNLDVRGWGRSILRPTRSIPTDQRCHPAAGGDAQHGAAVQSERTWFTGM